MPEIEPVTPVRTKETPMVVYVAAETPPCKPLQEKVIHHIERSVPDSEPVRMNFMLVPVSESAKDAYDTLIERNLGIKTAEDRALFRQRTSPSKYPETSEIPEYMSNLVDIYGGLPLRDQWFFIYNKTEFDQTGNPTGTPIGIITYNNVEHAQPYGFIIAQRTEINGTNSDNHTPVIVPFSVARKDTV